MPSSPNQTQIDFSHPREYTAETEKHYWDSVGHFSDQCRTILGYLKHGECLTNKKARDMFSIQMPATRIFELIKAGIDIRSKYIWRVKIYYLAEFEEKFKDL